MDECDECDECDEGDECDETGVGLTCLFGARLLRVPFRLIRELTLTLKLRLTCFVRRHDRLRLRRQYALWVVYDFKSVPLPVAHCLLDDPTYTAPGHVHQLCRGILGRAV